MTLPTLSTAWQTTHPAGTHIAPHAHDCWELVCYRTGDGDTQIDGRRSAIAPHTFALNPPHARHDEAHRAPCTLICVTFADDACALAPGVWPDDAGEVAALAQRLLVECRDQRPGYRRMTQLLLAALEIAVCRAQTTPGRVRRPRNLRFAVRFIDENYGRRIRISDLAAAYGYGYDYFQHSFRAAVGCSPQQYLQRVRLAAAAERLRQTADSCTQIALDCGFYDSAQFSAQFRAAMGCTPTAYRAAHRAAPSVK